MLVKSVQYSYPSSPNAERFGYEDGCYTIEVGDESKPLSAVAAFETLEEAREHADGIELPYSKYTR